MMGMLSSRRRDTTAARNSDLVAGCVRRYRAADGAPSAYANVSDRAGYAMARTPAHGLEPPGAVQAGAPCCAGRSRPGRRAAPRLAAERPKRRTGPRRAAVCSYGDRS